MTKWNYASEQTFINISCRPYRSGTNDDPDKIAENVKVITDIALQVYKIGHLPVPGEWFALPLIEAAGSRRIGDQVFNEIFHPVAIQLIDHCYAVLRIGGESAGADEMARTGKAKSKRIFNDLLETPLVRNNGKNINT